MAVSKFDGWAGYSGGSELLATGDAWPDDHPLVTDRPDLFGVEQEPEPPLTVEEVPPSVRKKPGPKPRSPREV